MTNEDIDAAAVAIRDCVEQFRSPVRYYVEPEAFERYREANPDADESDVDDLESWRIIARAALAAVPRK